MRKAFSMLWLILSFITAIAASPLVNVQYDRINPKLFIVAMFEPEEKVWTSNMDFVHHFPIPGLSPLHPNIHCNQEYSICQFTTGEGEINAANSMMALLLNPQFDFTNTYWLLTGIGGGEPSQVTTGTITFAKYAVQVGLQYQIDSIENSVAHPDWPTGYFSYGAPDPWTYPDSVYGTEVFELNENLRDRAVSLAKQNEHLLSVGSEGNIKLRNMYKHPANANPTIKACDVTTSDNYFIGNTLSDYYMNFTSMITNGTGVYCSAAQEENATLESFLRIAKYGMVHFDRIIVMRSISNFIRKPDAIADSLDFFQNTPKGGFEHALENMYIAGAPIIDDIMTNWDSIYKDGIKATNYIGDIFGTLGGKRDFGKDKYTIH